MSSNPSSSWASPMAGPVHLTSSFSLSAPPSSISLASASPPPSNLWGSNSSGSNNNNNSSNNNSANAAPHVPSSPLSQRSRFFSANSASPQPSASPISSPLNPTPLSTSLPSSLPSTSASVSASVSAPPCVRVPGTIAPPGSVPSSFASVCPIQSSVDSTLPHLADTEFAADSPFRQPIDLLPSASLAACSTASFSSSASFSTLPPSTLPSPALVSAQPSSSNACANQHTLFGAPISSLTSFSQTSASCPPSLPFAAWLSSSELPTVPSQPTPPPTNSALGCRPSASSAFSVPESELCPVLPCISSGTSSAVAGLPLSARPESSQPAPSSTSLPSSSTSDSSTAYCLPSPTSHSLTPHSEPGAASTSLRPLVAPPSSQIPELSPPSSSCPLFSLVPAQRLRSDILQLVQTLSHHPRAASSSFASSLSAAFTSVFNPSSKPSSALAPPSSVFSRVLSQSLLLAPSPRSSFSSISSSYPSFVPPEASSSPAALAYRWSQSRALSVKFAHWRLQLQERRLTLLLDVFRSLQLARRALPLFRRWIAAREDKVITLARASLRRQAHFILSSWREHRRLRAMSAQRLARALALRRHLRGWVKYMLIRADALLRTVSARHRYSSAAKKRALGFLFENYRVQKEWREKSDRARAHRSKHLKSLVVRRWSRKVTNKQLCSRVFATAMEMWECKLEDMKNEEQDRHLLSFQLLSKCISGWKSQVSLTQRAKRRRHRKLTAFKFRRLRLLASMLTQMKEFTKWSLQVGAAHDKVHSRYCKAVYLRLFSAWQRFTALSKAHVESMQLQLLVRSPLQRILCAWQRLVLEQRIIEHWRKSRIFKGWSLFVELHLWVGPWRHWRKGMLRKSLQGLRVLHRVSHLRHACASVRRCHLLNRCLVAWRYLAYRRQWVEQKLVQVGHDRTRSRQREAIRALWEAAFGRKRHHQQRQKASAFCRLKLQQTPFRLWKLFASENRELQRKMAKAIAFHQAKVEVKRLQAESRPSQLPVPPAPPSRVPSSSTSRSTASVPPAVVNCRRPTEPSPLVVSAAVELYRFSLTIIHAWRQYAQRQAALRDQERRVATILARRRVRRTFAAWCRATPFITLRGSHLPTSTLPALVQSAPVRSPFPAPIVPSTLEDKSLRVSSDLASLQQWRKALASSSSTLPSSLHDPTHDLPSTSSPCTILPGVSPALASSMPPSLVAALSQSLLMRPATQAAQPLPPTSSIPHPAFPLKDGGDYDEDALTLQNIKLRLKAARQG
eukprot:GILI01007599.1.p1 GENE.GILI01007599.1~~GILI01007599.1.p1  ORF type:complete len:1366 (+),score=223.45 GILI01007599.1:357-4100(+)